MANLPVTILMAGGGALLLWAGITKPAGGVWPELGRVLSGAPSPVGTGPSAADGTSFAAAFLTGPGSSSAATGGQAATGAAGAVIAFAKSQEGDAYLWGATGPNRWDCSGLTVKAMAAGGVKLPRTAALQQIAPGGTNVALANAQPGDLIFYGAPAHHVAIYLGGSRIVHAPYTGTVVREESVTGPGAPTTVRRFL